MLKREIETLRDQLYEASCEDRLTPIAVELATAKLTDIARRVGELEKRRVPPAARVSETDLGGGKILVFTS